MVIFWNAQKAIFPHSHIVFFSFKWGSAKLTIFFFFVKKLYLFSEVLNLT
jgi:hypothetical protein